jgi:hypothetical protein
MAGNMDAQKYVGLSSYYITIGFIPHIGELILDMDRGKNEGRGEGVDANCNERIRCKLKGERGIQDAGTVRNASCGCGDASCEDKEGCKLQIVRSGRDVSFEGCSVAQLGCSVAQLGCSVAQIECSVAQ